MPQALDAALRSARLPFVPISKTSDAFRYHATVSCGSDVTAFGRKISAIEATLIALTMKEVGESANSTNRYEVQWRASLLLVLSSFI